jgi:hypothetical protein
MEENLRKGTSPFSLFRYHKNISSILASFIPTETKDGSWMYYLKDLKTLPSLK